MNSSIFTVRKWQKLFAVFALCAMVLAPLAEVKAQAAPQPTLTIEKEIVGTTTVPYTDFSFLINGTGTTTFDVSGSNDVSVATGTYDITEVPVDGFVTTYSNCDNVVLATATSTATCTITNTASTTGSLDLGNLVIEKIIVGTTSATADDFTFDVVRNSLVNVETNEPFEAAGTNVYDVVTGLYTITEDTAAGFVTTYSNSLNGDDDCESLLVTPNATTTCTITNTATSTAPSTPSTGTLVVNKVVNGGNGATSSFSFLVNGGATTTVEADGSNVFSNMATGTYTITEVPIANYTPTYSNCASAVVTANATTTCTITNTFNVGGQPLYTIDGFKWHDEDRDGTWDAGEDALQGWTINANATGQLVRTDVTDSNGYYSLLVPAGTWTVSEVQQSGWDQIFPAGNSGHDVTFSTTSTSTADVNFGNAQNTSSGGGGGGGNGRKVELRDDNDDEDDDDDSDSGGGRSDDDDEDEDDDDTSGGAGSGPSGQVLGEQTDAFPYGAPNTGFGGGELEKMSGNATLPLLSMIMVMLLGFGVARAMNGDEEERI
jgi:hypothetical protein